jgi:hypothetical protein
MIAALRSHKKHPGPMMVRGYLNERATGGAVASPFEGGLGGSAPLLVRFLGASEKMNTLLLFSPKSENKTSFILNFTHFFVPLTSSKVLSLEIENKSIFILHFAHFFVPLHPSSRRTCLERQ